MLKNFAKIFRCKQFFQRCNFSILWRLSLSVISHPIVQKQQFCTVINKLYYYYNFFIVSYKLKSNGWYSFFFESWVMKWERRKEGKGRTQVSGSGPDLPLTLLPSSFPSFGFRSKEWRKEIPLMKILRLEKRERRIVSCTDRNEWSNCVIEWERTLDWLTWKERD